jgi:general secretion pathway protein J
MMTARCDLLTDRYPDVRHGDARGFTLIELLAAMTLFALLASILMGMVRNADRSTNAATASIERTEQYTRTHAFLSDHIANTLPLRWRRETNQPLKFEGKPSSITYLAPVISQIAEGGVLWWQLSLREQNGKKQLVLKRLPQDTEAKEVPDMKEGEASVLAEGIESITLAYFDPGEEPVREPEAGKWVDTWDENDRMPSMVRIKVRETNGTGWPDLVVPMKISQAVGCNFDFARQRCIISSTGLPVRRTP